MSEGPPQPRVTVVIPSHGHKRWLGEAIDSVALQDYPDTFLVVVDDGCPDGSARYVLDRLYRPGLRKGPDGADAFYGKLRHTDLRVILLSHYPARGPSFARNRGVRFAWNDTDLFFFLDSDDLYLPGKVSASVAKWLEAPEHTGVVYSDYETFRDGGSLALAQYKEPYARERLMSECLPNMDSLVSKAAFEKVGLFDESLRTCEDLDLWHRVCEHFLLAHLPRQLLRVRVGSHSSSSTVAKAAWEENYRRVMEKTQARLRGGP